MAHIGFHIIQSFPPNNLNRDDTGAPKDCQFGGVRRARVSSQAWKRSVRFAFNTEAAFNGHRAIRTRRLQERLVGEFAARGTDAGPAAEIAEGVVDALVGRNPKNPEESAVLLFITDEECTALADWALAHQESILAAHPTTPGTGSEEPETPKRGRKSKATGGPGWEAIVAEARALLTSPRAVDTALFGRMLAEVDGAGIEAAASVAHAISTHAVQMEEDYFTAVDDLKQLSEGTDQGSGMIGEVLYQSAVLYRYATIDTDQLLQGLGGPSAAELAREALTAFTRAFVSAIPSGKQTTFAAYNPPSAVLVTHDSQPVSLANAFLCPVAPRAGRRIDAQSLAALAAEWKALADYTGATNAVAVAAIDPVVCDIGPLADVPRATLVELPGIVAGLLDGISAEAT